MNTSTKFKGNPVQTAGEFLKVGQQAPDFKLVKGDLSEFNLFSVRGKRVLLNIFPSIDTPVCAMSVREFNEMAAKMKNTLVLCISKDLPFAQSRFCVAEGIENVLTLSDFHYGSKFGENYGVVMVDGVLNGLFARSVIIIDEMGKVIYSKMTDDIIEEPDYDEAMKVIGD